MSQILYTLDEAATMLGCTPRWLADQFRDGRFPAKKISRRWMLSDDDLREIVKLCAVPAQAESE